MSRLYRLDPEHGIHHVYSRGTRRWTLFIDEHDYEQFMRRLGVVCMRYEARVYSYCLMGNHFHLVLYCPHGNLSASMRDLKSLYARLHNDRHGFSGPLFESRFGSKIVRSYSYLRTLIRYVHRNPIAVNANKPLQLYRWSSHAHYLHPDAQRPEWLDIDFPRSLFGTSDDYRTVVETNTESDETRLLARRVGDGIRPALLPHRPAISTIMLVVAKCAGCEVADLRPRHRNGLVGLVVVIASDRSDYNAAELADACGYTSAGGVRNARGSTRKRLSQSEELRALYHQVVATLAL